MLSTVRLIRLADCDASGGIPVGNATPGTTVLVLAEDGRRCAPGENGEVCFAGDGLATGYLDQPEMTAEKFPTLQIDGVPIRVYRTGDVGVLDDEGVLHFRGRRDRQVKISGHRVELPEVEVTARGLEGVRHCIALPLLAPDGSADRLALCYITDSEDPQAPGGPSESEVRAALARMLPAYLVPAVVRRLDRFPVTANGKTDLAELARIAAAPRRVAR